MVYKLQRWTGQCIPTRCDITVNVVSTLSSELTPVWYTGTNIQRNTLSQYFVNRKMVAAVSLKMKQWFPIISLHSVITKRNKYRDIHSHTWSLLGDNYTLSQQTSGKPAFRDLGVESENIFFKAKLWYHISDSTMTKHQCLHIQSPNAWQTTDQNSVTVCFSSKLHSQLGAFKITLSSVGVHQGPGASWFCQDFSVYFSK